MMTLREFIREYRRDLDAQIRLQITNVGRLNDEDREEWVLNDENLYRWAQSEGVKI